MAALRRLAGSLHLCFAELGMLCDFRVFADAERTAGVASTRGSFPMHSFPRNDVVARLGAAWEAHVTVMKLSKGRRWLKTLAVRPLYAAELPAFQTTTFGVCDVNTVELSFMRRRDADGCAWLCLWFWLLCVGVRVLYFFLFWCDVGRLRVRRQGGAGGSGGPFGGSEGRRCGGW